MFQKFLKATSVFYAPEGWYEASSF